MEAWIEKDEKDAKQYIKINNVVDKRTTLPMGWADNAGRVVWLGTLLGLGYLAV